MHIDDSLADHAEDVLNSLLLAQLVADRKASRFTAPASWVQEFESVLATIGWVIDHRDTGSSSAGGQDVVPLDMIAEDLRKVLGPDQVSTVRAAVTALATAAAPVSACWRQRTTAGDAAASTICFAARVDQSPWLAVNCTALTAATAITDYPWAAAPAGVERTVNQATAELNESVFAAVRDGIRTKVAPVRDSNVMAVTS
ncbi:hypothetical protein GCM10029964_010950 [Kibdelosporangium lantanae]